MNIGIVGSRSFPQLKLVEWFVAELPQGVTVVSGGAAGVDATAAASARGCGLAVVEHRPDLAGCKARHEHTKRYYARNQRIVDDCDVLVAFTEKPRGGTWDTIKRARRAGKPVKIIRPSAVAADNVPIGEPAGIDASIDNGQQPPHVGHSADDAQAGDKSKPPAAGRTKGAGPFHLKRVSLGSFALHLKRYIDTVAWADFINAKDADPERCAKMMLGDFLEFFQANGRFGVIHAITQPPQSKRRGDKPHPMDFVGRDVAAAVGARYVQVFKPWDKRRRGRHAAHPEIEINANARRLAGKVVFVLDDVSTTNYTLRAAVGALSACEIHAHGVCWVQYA
jgi:phosphoribosylpyrophosphate synthetase